jgi:hypothetical protein
VLNRDIARVCETETSVINTTIKRYSDEFTQDMAFQLTAGECDILKARGFVKSRSRHMPWAFTENGVTFLSTIMRSDKLAQLNRSLEWDRWGEASRSS